MKSKKLFGIITLLAIALLIITSVIPAKANTPTIWTDKADYLPGETVTIYGSGFDPNGDLVVIVERPDGHIDSSEDTGTDVVHKITIVSWAEGDFTATYQLDGIEGTYTVTATDGTNVATTTFTDTRYSLEGETLESPYGWTSGILKGWMEDDEVPYRLALIDVEATIYTFSNYHDNELGGVTGIDYCTDFFVGDADGNPAPTSEVTFSTSGAFYQHQYQSRKFTIHGK